MKEETKKPVMNWIQMGAIAVAVGAAGFFGGMKYQQTKQPMGRIGQFGGGNDPGRGGQFQGAPGVAGGRGGNAFRPVMGEILSSDDKSITVKMPDGSSKIVLFSDSTQINKADQASKTDLQTGTKVAVFGQTNSDGSVTAQNIQINPMMRVPQPQQ